MDYKGKYDNLCNDLIKHCNKAPTKGISEEEVDKFLQRSIIATSHIQKLVLDLKSVYGEIEKARFEDDDLPEEGDMFMMLNKNIKEFKNDLMQTKKRLKINTKGKRV